jgi:hypothetical protein
MRSGVTKKPLRSNVGTPPRERKPAAAPPNRAVPRTPKGDPRAQARPPEPSRPPMQRGVGRPPNPRKPKLVRDVHGNELRDLFQMFPDLPRPPRRPARVPLRVRGRKGRP